MKKIISTIVFLAAGFTFLTAGAQEDAVFNRLVHEYTLNDDGSSSFREYRELKLLSHMAFHRLYGETFVIYDPMYQELKIDKAYTIMRDGSRVDVPGNAFNEVLPYDAANAAPYNHLREMVITHTGLEVGATIYLDYTVSSKPGYYPAFVGEATVRDLVPVKEKQVIINIPAGEELQYKMLGLRTAPGISENGKLRTYTFTFRDVKPYYQAWGVDYEAMPRLFFSTAKDFQRAYFPFVSQEAFTFQVNADMAEKAGELKGKYDDPLKSALAIQQMVVEEIGTWELWFGYTGFSCRTPIEVWRSNAGTRLEKTVLMASLLRSAGFQAVPVAIFPARYFDERVGSLDLFRDFAVQLSLDGRRMYLSAYRTHAGDLSFSFGNKMILVLDGAIETARPFETDIQPSVIEYRIEGRINDSLQLTGLADIQLGQGANPYYSLFNDTSYAKRLFPGSKDATIISLNLEKSHLTLEVEKKEALKQYGDLCFLELPSAPNGTNSWGYTYVETGRPEPIHLPALLKEQYEFVLEVPEGFSLISPEANIQIENGLGKVMISLNQEKNSIRIIRAIELRKGDIMTSEFDAFNSLWEAWMNPSLKTVVIKKKA